MTEPVEAQPSNLTRPAIEHMAEAWSRAAGYLPAMSLTEIVDRFGGQLIVSDELEDLDHGSIVVNDKSDFKIRIPAFTTAVSNRFTVAHELGHYILHYIWPKSEGVSQGPIFASRYGTGPAEDEANWFASAFLMPRQDFVGVWEKSQSILSAALFFNVSTSDAYNRAIQLNLASLNAGDAPLSEPSATSSLASY